MSLVRRISGGYTRVDPEVSTKVCAPFPSMSVRGRMYTCMCVSLQSVARFANLPYYCDQENSNSAWISGSCMQKAYCHLTRYFDYVIYIYTYIHMHTCSCLNGKAHIEENKYQRGNIQAAP